MNLKIKADPTIFQPQGGGFNATMDLAIQGKLNLGAAQLKTAPYQDPSNSISTLKHIDPNPVKKKPAVLALRSSGFSAQNGSQNSQLGSFEIDEIRLNNENFQSSQPAAQHRLKPGENKFESSTANLLDPNAGNMLHQMKQSGISDLGESQISQSGIGSAIPVQTLRPNLLPAAYRDPEIASILSKYLPSKDTAFQQDKRTLGNSDTNEARHSQIQTMPMRQSATIGEVPKAYVSSYLNNNSSSKKHETQTVMNSSDSFNKDSFYIPGAYKPQVNAITIPTAIITSQYSTFSTPVKQPYLISDQSKTPLQTRIQIPSSDSKVYPTLRAQLDASNGEAGRGIETRAMRQPHSAIKSFISNSRVGYSPSPTLQFQKPFYESSKNYPSFITKPQTQDPIHPDNPSSSQFRLQSGYLTRESEASRLPQQDDSQSVNDSTSKKHQRSVSFNFNPRHEISEQSDKRNPSQRSIRSILKNKTSSMSPIPKYVEIGKRYEYLQTPTRLWNSNSFATPVTTSSNLTSGLQFPNPLLNASPSPIPVHSYQSLSKLASDPYRIASAPSYDHHQHQMPYQSSHDVLTTKKTDLNIDELLVKYGLSGGSRIGTTSGSTLGSSVLKPISSSSIINYS